MITTIAVDKAGRVVLPKPVRDALQLEAGDVLELRSSEDQIILQPVRGNASIRKKHGVWVYDAGQSLSTGTVNETVRRVRAERHAQNLGKTR